MSVVRSEWAQSIWGPDETCARDNNGQRIPCSWQLHVTVAPTGTISIIAGCSSGLEPLFAVAFMRNQAGVMMPDVNEDFVAIAKAEGWYSDELMERIAKTGSVQHAEVPAKWQAVFNTANNISPEYHIRMQAAYQQHCDSAISKTTNFGFAATVDDVRAIYEMAYDMKCKGVTVYRDGSRDNQVLSTGATQDAAAKREDAKAAVSGEAPKADAKAEVALKREIGELQGTIAELQNELDRTRKQLFSAEAENASRRGKRARPDVMRGTTIRKETLLGTMFVNITEDEKGQPFEVFSASARPAAAPWPTPKPSAVGITRAAFGSPCRRSTVSCAASRPTAPWARAQQGAVDARRHRHRVGDVAAREAGRAAGSAERRQWRRGRSGAGERVAAAGAHAGRGRADHASADGR